MRDSSPKKIHKWEIGAWKDAQHHQSFSSVQFSSVQSLSRVRLLATPRIAACQASLSITISQSSLTLTSIKSVMPSSHLILCHPLLLLPPIPPSIKVFSNESTLREMQIRITKTYHLIPVRMAIIKQKGDDDDNKCYWLRMWRKGNPWTLLAGCKLVHSLWKTVQRFLKNLIIQLPYGFRKGRGTRDQIANIHWIIAKAREFQKNIYFCFIDYAKAFDCVDHNKLWTILREMGIPYHLTCLLRNLYAGQEATIRTGHGSTDWFQIGKGIYCHPAYLTYMQSTSWETLGWMKHKLE